MSNLLLKVKNLVLKHRLAIGAVGIILLLVHLSGRC